MDIIGKIMGILLKTDETLTMLKDEPDTLQESIFYLSILALIPFVATFIGYTAVGFAGGNGNIRLPIGSALTHVVVQYILTVGGVFLAALYVNLLAPQLGGKNDFPQALKTIVYACTPSLIGGVLSIHHKLSLTGSAAGFIIGLVIALYGVYILYQAIPILMESPRTTVSTYTLLAAVGGVAIWVVCDMLNNLIARSIMNEAVNRML
jgi:hypothetical protein